MVLIGVVALLFAAYHLLTQKNSPFYQPINGYQLTSPLQELKPEEVTEVVKPYLGSSFWDMPLDKLQAEFTRMDWVESAEVKRQWPDQLYIHIKEQVPVARWNEDGLINGAGEVFFPADISAYADLVQLQGKLEDSTIILAELVKAQALFNEVEMTIASISLQDQVWYLKTLQGPEIIIDSNHADAKLQRFVKALPKLDKALRNSARVYDLRYSNGFIVANK